MQTLEPLPNWYNEQPEQILQRIALAGISGMGGGGFDTARKMRFARQAKVTQVIANAVECEPGIEVDSKLLAEHSNAVVQGLRIAMAAVGATQGTLAHAADFAAATRSAIAQQFTDLVERTDQDQTTSQQRQRLQAVAITRSAGAGAERELCHRLFGLTLAPDQRPIDRGVLCLNAATLFAIQQAVELGQPLQQRLITINGDTRWVELGTPIADLVSDAPASSIYRVGGHYTGKRQTPQTLVGAATNAIWTQAPVVATPCTYCARCADDCPEALAPQVLLRLSQEAATQAQLEVQGLQRCTECGLCNDRCPSNIDLLSHLQQAKATIKAQQADERAAQRAKQRHERHLVRVQTRADAAQQRRDERRDARRQRQRGPDAWR